MNVRTISSNGHVLVNLEDVVNHYHGPRDITYDDLMYMHASKFITPDMTYRGDDLYVDPVALYKVWRDHIVVVDLHAYHPTMRLLHHLITKPDRCPIVFVKCMAQTLHKLCVTESEVVYMLTLLSMDVSLQPWYTKPARQIFHIPLTGCPYNVPTPATFYVILCELARCIGQSTLITLPTAEYLCHVLTRSLLIGRQGVPRQVQQGHIRVLV